MKGRAKRSSPTLHNGQLGLRLLPYNDVSVVSKYPNTNYHYLHYLAPPRTESPGGEGTLLDVSIYPFLKTHNRI